jgi:hypothetical protein
MLKAALQVRCKMSSEEEAKAGKLLFQAPIMGEYQEQGSSPGPSDSEPVAVGFSGSRY